MLRFFVSHSLKFPPINKNAAVKLLRRKVFTSLLYIKVDRPLPWRSVNLSWSKRSKSIFLSETNHDSLQVSNWGTDEKQVNTFLFKNHLQNRYIGEFLNSLNCFSDKEPKSFCASSCSSSRRKAHISRKLSDVLDIIACNSDFS